MSVNAPGLLTVESMTGSDIVELCVSSTGGGTPGTVELPQRKRLVVRVGMDELVPEVVMRSWCQVIIIVVA